MGNNQWQPAHTAPKDGRRYLGAYRTESGAWICEVCGGYPAQTVHGKLFPMTHWKELGKTPRGIK